MGRPTEINLCSRIGCHVIYSRGSRRSLTLLRELLCVRKSRAIRNEHEGPPRRSLFGLASELLPDRARCFASTIPPRSAGDATENEDLRSAATETLLEYRVLISLRDKLRSSIEKYYSASMSNRLSIICISIRIIIVIKAQSARR